MSKKLYVGNLPFSVDDHQLQDLVNPYGEIVSASVVMDKMSGRSKGFGFVEFSNADEADKAVAELNGREIGGRPLVVNEARPMTPRAPRSFGGGGGGGGYGGGGRRGGGGGRDRDQRGGGGRDRDRGGHGGGARW